MSEHEPGQHEVEQSAKMNQGFATPAKAGAHQPDDREGVSRGRRCFSRPLRLSVVSEYYGECVAY